MYSIYIGASRIGLHSDDRRFNFGEDINAIMKDISVPKLADSFNDGFNGPYKKFCDSVYTEGRGIILVENTVDYDCRESVVWFLDSVVDFYRKNVIHYNIPYVYIQFPADTFGTASTYAQDVQKFGDRYINGTRSLYNLRVCNDGATISLEWKIYTANHLISLWTVSMLLYILRNPSLISEILEKYPEPSNIKELCKNLSVEFLNHPSWGNSYNPSLSMSVFCYHVANSKSLMCGFRNGPVEAVMSGITPLDLINYIRDVFLKVFPTGTTIPKNLGADSLWDKFKEGFETILQLIQYSKNNEAAVAKKPEKIDREKELSMLELVFEQVGEEGS